MLPVYTFQSLHLSMVCAQRFFLHWSMLFFWVAIMPLSVEAQSGCSCLNCPLFLEDLSTNNFYVSVNNAANPTLGQNGQGVCGVRVHFDHTALCDISITLTSPSGQVITLVGPIGPVPFCASMGTDGTDWNVTFIPCNDPSVAPDPGFTNKWFNGQNWGANNVYSGTYYPFIGCLENLTGPVDGVWTLTVTDGQGNDVGNLIDYEITFCDPSGIDCYSCVAEAGVLEQKDFAVCEGSSGLLFNLPPTYNAPDVPPPGNEYTYAYIISAPPGPAGGPGGAIMAIETVLDFSAYPPGMYTICGLSYLTADIDKLPVPDPLLTVGQLINQLASIQPPFCGDITTNCVTVTILPAKENEEEFVSLCYPECYEFYGFTYCKSGTYVRDLYFNGCPYSATLNLTINQPNTTYQNETLCEGECSSNPLFPDACFTDSYEATIQNIYGCDSIVVLNLFVIGAESYIQPPPILQCGQSSAVLSGGGSSSGIGITYSWSANNGGTILGPSHLANVTIGSAGDYSLKVCRKYGSFLCCDSSMVTVTADTSPPPAPSNLQGDSSICLSQSDTFSINPVVGANGYAWTVPTGVAIDTGQNTTTVIVSWDTLKAGNICVAAINACGTGPATCFPVRVDTIQLPSQPIGLSVVCPDSIVVYSTSLNPEVDSFTWSVTPPATILSGQGSPQIIVRWGTAPNGDVCVVANSTCGSSLPVCLPVAIGSTPLPPSVPNGNTVVCAGNIETYTTPPVVGVSDYLWQVSGGTIISGDSSPVVQVIWNPNTPTGSLCVAAQNDCGVSTVACTTVNMITTLPLPSVSGDATLCAGTTGTYSIVPVPGAQTYDWTVPSNGVILSGQNTASILVNWLSTPGGDVCVFAANDCDTSATACFNVNISPALPLPVLSGDGVLCAGTSGSYS
ncbi:MAG: hypothetical protein ACOYNO_14795, partial [Saprospiraceae bacterium]